MTGRREVALLFGALGAFYLSISMLLPTLPLYVVDLGGSPVQVGLVAGGFSIGVLLARPFVGRAVDTRGRRPLLIAGSLTAAAMAPLYAVPVIAALVVVRLIHGAGLSAFTSASTALGADYAPPGRRTEILGWLSTAGIVAFAVGPFIGLEIARRLGWPTLFGAICVCALASAACGAYLPRPARRDRDASTGGFRAVVMRRAVLAPTIVNLLVVTAHGAAFTFVPILLEQRLTFNFGVFFLVYALASLAVRLFAGRLSRTVGDGPMVWGGLALYAAGLAWLPFVDDVTHMIVSAVLLGVGFGTYQPAIFGLVANASTEATRGMVFSILLGGFDLGMSVGGLLGGPLAQAMGIPALLGVMAAVPVAAAAIFVIALGWRPTPEAECESALAGVA